MKDGATSCPSRIAPCSPLRRGDGGWLVERSDPLCSEVQARPDLPPITPHPRIGGDGILTRTIGHYLPHVHAWTHGHLVFNPATEPAVAGDQGLLMCSGGNRTAPPPRSTRFGQTYCTWKESNLHTPLPGPHIIRSPTWDRTRDLRVNSSLLCR